MNEFNDNLYKLLKVADEKIRYIDTEFFKIQVGNSTYTFYKRIGIDVNMHFYVRYYYNVDHCDGHPYVSTPFHSVQSMYLDFINKMKP